MQQFVDARTSGDWSRTWDLMCRSEREFHGSKDGYLAGNEGRRWLPGQRLVADAASPFEPFPVEAWTVVVRKDRNARRYVEYLVIREDGDLRVCGDPHGLYERGF